MSDNNSVESYVNGLKVVELREELKKRGITSYGVKSVLAERLITALKDEENKVNDQPEEDGKQAEDEPQLQPDAEAREPSAHAQENEDEVGEHTTTLVSIQPAGCDVFIALWKKRVVSKPNSLNELINLRIHNL